MPKTTTLTVRLPVEIKGRLEKLATATDRTKAYLASRAIEAYLDAQEWQVRAIEEAVEAADRPDAEFTEHEELRARFEKDARTTAGKKAR